MNENKIDIYNSVDFIVKFIVNLSYLSRAILYNNACTAHVHEHTDTVQPARQPDKQMEIHIKTRRQDSKNCSK